MTAFLQDLRYGARLLLKTPGFTLIAIAALAIGVGANIAVFSFANTLLLKPLDPEQPDRLIRAYSDAADIVSLVDYDDYLQYRERNRSLSHLAMFHWGGLAPVRAGGPPEMIHRMPVTGNYFETLGVRAALGRTITPRDDDPGAPGAVVLSDTAWQRHFGADTGIIGRTIFIGRIPFTVIGVLPASFTGTIGAPIIPQLYIPWNGPYGPRTSRGGGQLIGRLKPSVSRGEAQADLSRIAAQLTAEHNRRISISVYPATALAPAVSGTMSLFAALFLAVAGLVLLIACDNIAILLLARTAARRREIGIRLALGASRGQLLRQLLAESLLLSVLGGLTAAAFAAVTAGWLTQVHLPVPMPVGLTFDFDWRVIAFAAGLSLAATLLFGLGPALQSLKTDVVSSLKEGAQAGGTRGSRMRSGLVIAQVAMSTTLLVTAGALVRSLAAPEGQARGFSSGRVLMATMNLPASDYSTSQGVTFYERLIERMESTAGIVSATITDNVPLTNNNPLSPVEMHKETSDAQASVMEGAERGYINRVSRGHFGTLSIPLLEGRDFTARDISGSTPVGIVNETLARRFWPGESPLGKRLRAADGPWIEVVGVARDSKYTSVDETPKAFLYRPISQEYIATATLLVKTSGDASAMASLVRAKVAEIDPNLLAYNLNTLEERIGLNLLANRAAALVSAVLGLLALALGAVGTYGIMSFLVQQRRREIGVRIALGAPPARVVSLITRQGMTWTAIGLAAGLAGALAVTRFLRGILQGIAAADPIAFVSITVLLAGTAYVACYIPARRASRIDPLVALREE